MTDTANDPLLGRQIGRCAIQRKLGEGGMGAVYLAQHAGLNKAVALKILPKAFAGNPDFIARFQREARLAARLDHPNVVQVFDVGEAEGLHYITMQYVEGKGLDVLLKERGALSTNEALSITKRIALALESARRLGIIHRDIKPANILLSKDGIVKVADFGLAKDREAQGSISESGQIVGTPHYMSPEQAEGKAVDHRGDIYSLGATLYHMLSGKRPFDGPTPLSVVVKAIHDVPAPLRSIDPRIPAAVATLVERMMAKDPARRPQTGEALAADIDALKSAPAIVAPPAGRRAAMVALPVAGILVLGVILGMILSRPAPTPPSPTAVAAPPPKPEPPPVPPPPKPEPRRGEAILASFQDVQERRLAEDLMERVEQLMKAVKAGEARAVEGCFDRLTHGDGAGEAARKLIDERGRLQGWDFDEVQIRPRVLGRPPMAQVTLQFELETPKGRLKTRSGPQHWVRRLDGGWLLARPSR